MNGLWLNQAGGAPPGSGCLTGRGFSDPILEENFGAVKFLAKWSATCLLTVHPGRFKLV